MSRGKNLRILTKRADFLERRIEQSAAAGDQNLSFDRSELRALRWAVQQLSELPDRRPLPAASSPVPDDSTDWGEA